MAIKFSELRGLLKDTNIQTIKMSDPAYSIQMEKIVYGKGYRYTDTPKSITFNRLNVLKNNNYFWLVHQLTAFSIRVYLAIQPKTLDNTRILLTKQMIYSYYAKEIKSNIATKFWYLIENCFSLNSNNTNILNPHLIKFQLRSIDEPPYFPNVSINKYYNGDWHLLNPVGILSGFRGRYIRNFYNYELIDSDTNLKSSAMFYTNPISNAKEITIECLLGYKPNDKFTKRYMSSLLSIEFYLIGTNFYNKIMDVNRNNVGTGSGVLTDYHADNGLYTPDEIEGLNE